MANVIFTKNALRNIHEQNLSQKIIYEVIQYGERSPALQPGVTQFRRNMNFGRVTVIGKQIKEGWLVISCWAKKPTNFHNKPINMPHKKISFLEKLLRDIIKTFKQTNSGQDT